MALRQRQAALAPTKASGNLLKLRNSQQQAAVSIGQDLVELAARTFYLSFYISQYRKFSVSACYVVVVVVVGIAVVDVIAVIDVLTCSLKHQL